MLKTIPELLTAIERAVKNQNEDYRRVERAVSVQNAHTAGVLEELLEEQKKMNDLLQRLLDPASTLVDDIATTKPGG